MNRNALSLCLILLSLGACGGDRSAAPPAAEEAPAAPTAEQTPTAPATGQTAGEAPIGPISSHGEVVTEGPGPAQAQGMGAIDFDLPSAWQAQKPSSNMRIAQASIPGPAGAGDLAVFYFGPGSGGSVEANIDRWVGQMETQDRPKPEIFDTHGYKVTWVDVRGTMKAGSMGMGPSTAQPESRLFGAVVEGPGGPWFFKATGPEATMAPARDAFVAMLESVRAK